MQLLYPAHLVMIIVIIIPLSSFIVIVIVIPAARPAPHSVTAFYGTFIFCYCLMSIIIVVVAYKVYASVTFIVSPAQSTWTEQWQDNYIWNCGPPPFQGHRHSFVTHTHTHTVSCLVCSLFLTYNNHTCKGHVT